MKVELSKITAVAIGGTFVDVNMEKELEYEDSLDVVDEDDDTIITDESPIIAFTGMDGHHYIVNLNSVNAFRIKP
jgi:hypothetical protein